MSHKSFLENMVRYVVNATASKREVRKEGLRCSSPPVCEIATAFKLLKQCAVDRQEFRSDYYTSIGTVLHKVFQKWAGRLGFLYGTWRCAACNYKTVGKGPQVCPKCHKEMEYIEAAVTSVENIRGHVDGLLPTADGYIVFDLKFVGRTTLAAVEKEPSKSHYYQVNLYAYALSRKYPIVGCAVVYISRDNPSQFKVHYFDGIDMNAISFCKDIVQKVKRAIETPVKLAELKMSCSSEEEAQSLYCPYQKICFSHYGPYAYLKDLANRK